MKTIYNTLLEHLNTEVPELKWIDEQLGQMQFEKPTVAFPAALLDIDFPKTENILPKLQKGQGLLMVDFCFDFTGNRTANAFSRIARENSLKHWDVVEKGTKALQGFESEYFNELERIAVGDRLKRPGYKVITVTFKFSFREDLN